MVSLSRDFDPGPDQTLVIRWSVLLSATTGEEEMMLRTDVTKLLKGTGFSGLMS